MSSQLFKNIFSRGEKHRHECNQVCNSTNDPKKKNILNSQEHLSTRIFKAHGSQKTHAHTKQVYDTMLLRWRCEHWDAVTWQELMWNNPRVLRWDHKASSYSVRRS